MSLIVRTAHYTSRDPDRLDITRAGCDRLARAQYVNPGIILAPSAALVFPTLRRLKEATTDAERDAVFATYADAYRVEMRESFTMQRPDWQALLARERVVLVCFCRDHRRCHRSLAAEILAACGADNRGEIA